MGRVSNPCAATGAVIRGQGLGLRRQEGTQRREPRLLTACGIFGSYSFQGALGEVQRPVALEDRVWRRLLIQGAQQGHTFGLDGVDRLVRRAASSTERQIVQSCARQKVMRGSQQVTTKPAAGLVGAFEDTMLQKMEKERLRQIRALVGWVAAT